MNTTPTQMYCAELLHHGGGVYFSHFFRNMRGTKMCIDRETTIYEVLVSEGVETPGSYWGWWDAENKTFCMVFRTRTLVECCFPYGSKAEEDRGRGKLLPVNVQIIRKVEP